MTVGDLINASLRKLGVLASGEEPDASEQSDALVALQNLVDSWSIESLMVYTKIREAFQLLAGQQTYTFGPGGDFDSSRPERIENAAIQLAGTNPIAEIPISVVNKDQFAKLVIKQLTSSLPLGVYNDDNNPLANVQFWPIPNQAMGVVFYSWKPLSNFTTINETIVLPPGYLRALVFNLAVELAPDFGVVAPDIVIAEAIQAKSKIKRRNSKPLFMSTDPALSGIRRGSFNWLKGDTD